MSKTIKDLWSGFWAVFPLIGLFIIIGSHFFDSEPMTGKLALALAIITLSALIFLPVTGLPLLNFVLGKASKETSASDGQASEIFINAPSQAVWDLFEPRPREESFLLGVSKIEGIESPGSQPQIALVMDKEIVGFDKRYFARVETVEPERFIRLHYIHPVPETMGMRTLRAEYEIHPTDDGTWVRYQEDVDHRSNVSKLMLRWISPADDMLKSLKARVEGTEDQTLAGKVEAARRRGAPIEDAVTSHTTFNWLKIGLPAAALALTLFIPIFMWALFVVIDV